MKLYMIKHYWKDGENATWECHTKIDKDLFQYVKENYHIFKEERPKVLKKDSTLIYFCYEDTTDFANRSITNMIFFISKKKVNLDLCKKTKIEGLELIIPKKSNSLLIPILGISLLVGAIYYNEDSPKELIVPEPIVMDYTSFIDDWNKQSNKELRLSRHSNEEMIKQLNQFMMDSRTDENNESIWKAYTGHTIDAYKVFRKNHYDDFNITFNVDMSEDKIKSKLKKAIGEKTMSGIINKVLMMNDIEVWKNNKEN